MTDTIILYLVVGAAVLLAVLSIAIKLEKMVRVIVGNFVLGFLCFFSVISLNNLGTSLGGDAGFGKFLIESRYFVAFLIYVIGRFFAYRNSSIKMKSQGDIVMENISYILFVPITVIGTILTITFILVGPMVWSGTNLGDVANMISNNEYIHLIIIHLPEMFIAYSLISFLAFCNFKSKGGDSPKIVS